MSFVKSVRKEKAFGPRLGLAFQAKDNWRSLVSALSGVNESSFNCVSLVIFRFVIFKIRKLLAYFCPINLIISLDAGVVTVKATILQFGNRWMVDRITSCNGSFLPNIENCLHTNDTVLHNSHIFRPSAPQIDTFNQKVCQCMGEIGVSIGHGRIQSCKLGITNALLHAEYMERV